MSAEKWAPYFFNSGIGPFECYLRDTYNASIMELYSCIVWYINFGVNMNIYTGLFVSLFCATTVAFSADAEAGEKNQVREVRGACPVSPDRRGSNCSTDTSPDSRLSEGSHEGSGHGGALEPFRVPSTPVLWRVTTETLLGWKADLAASRSTVENYLSEDPAPREELADRIKRYRLGHSHDAHLSLFAVLMSIASAKAAEASGDSRYDFDHLNDGRGSFYIPENSGAFFDLPALEERLYVSLDFVPDERRLNAIFGYLNDLAQWLRENPSVAEQSIDALGVSISSTELYLIACGIFNRIPNK